MQWSEDIAQTALWILTVMTVVGSSSLLASSELLECGTHTRCTPQFTWQRDPYRETRSAA